MTDISFYQVKDATPAAVDLAVAKLLEKVLKSGHKAVVRCPSEMRLSRLNQNLWSYDATSFLPHGSAQDGRGDQQPVYLSCDLENPADADILVTLSGADAGDFSTFSRVLDIFEGADAAVSNARARWKNYQQKGYPMAYFAYLDGKWQKKV